MKLFDEIETVASAAPNQYALAMAVAKRVKHLRTGAPPLTDINAHERPFEAAYAEFAKGLVVYEVPEQLTDPASEARRFVSNQGFVEEGEDSE
ncbi:hypothetical protein JW921_02360 [Candidatus Fermentibacterales bacterium]|nr:hypothetical protein [Candidatus Fermentibacterales bacterium]